MNTMKKVYILSTVYRVCCAIVCLNIGTKLASNKRIILLSLSMDAKKKQLIVTQPEPYSTPLSVLNMLFLAFYTASQKQSVQETLINLIYFIIK